MWGAISRAFVKRLLNRWIKWYYHCVIPLILTLKGASFVIVDFCVVINPNVTLGEGTYIQHGVTIGARDDIGATDAPVVGSKCYIGANATILGNIKIGDNVKIGAGAVVLKDVPSNCTVVGVPARIIQKANVNKTK